MISVTTLENKNCKIEQIIKGVQAQLYLTAFIPTFLRSVSGQDSKEEDSGIGAPPDMPIVIDHIALKDILGPPLFEMEVSVK